MEAPDVLVGDRGGENLPLLDRLLLHFDEGLLGDLDDAPRGRADDHERKRAAHESNAGDDDHVPLHHGALQEPPLHEVLDALAEAYLVPFADDGGDGDSLGAIHSGLLDFHLIADGDAQVAPDEAVDANNALPLVLLHGPEELRGRALLADDLDDLSHVDAQGHPRTGIHPGATQPDVRLRGLGDLQNHAIWHPICSTRAALFDDMGYLAVPDNRGQPVSVVDAWMASVRVMSPRATFSANPCEIVRRPPERMRLLR